MNISMIVTTFNRAALLERSLETLSGLTWPDELIVVDDGGSDDTERVCARWEERYPITYVYNDRPGWGNRCQPTNVAIRLASSPLVLHTDPEVEFLTDLVAQFRDARYAHPEAILAPWDGYHDVREGCSLDDCFLACPGNGLHNCGGNAFLYDRQWLLDIGGWDEAMHPQMGYDDGDLHKRLSWAGHEQLPVPGSAVRHRWHLVSPWHNGEMTDNPNQAIFEAKRYPGDLVANKGREWGVLYR